MIQRRDDSRTVVCTPCSLGVIEAAQIDVADTVGWSCSHSLVVWRLVSDEEKADNDNLHCPGNRPEWVAP